MFVAHRIARVVPDEFYTTASAEPRAKFPLLRQLLIMTYCRSHAPLLKSFGT